MASRRLAQSVGFPVPSGGSGSLAAALTRRAHAAGAEIQLDCGVDHIDVRRGRAVGVVTRNGHIGARRAVTAACDAQLLYGQLLDESDIPTAFLARVRQFTRAGSTVKVNYAVSTPVPWSDDGATGAGTVHIADSVNELSATAGQIAAGMLPSRPFLLIGQMTTADPTRSPAGTESLWAYTHVPQSITSDSAGEIDASGRLEGAALAQFVLRMEDRIEAHAPGFRRAVLARDIQGPADLERENAS